MEILELLWQIFGMFLQAFFTMLNPVVLIPLAVILLVYLKKNKDYKKGAYYQITKIPYLFIRRDLGRYGEYLTYRRLKCFEADGAKFLFNIYIPKKNGETTEIDVLMICPKGIFVFESKNYSGWIFGNESQKNWYQTLPAGRGRSHKEHFYNPIMQNNTHIKHLKAFLVEDVPMRSMIVFSDRCTLKDIQIKSNDIFVINRYQVAPAVSAICNQISTDLLSDEAIANIYGKLYPYTQADAKTKAKHVADIHNKLAQQPQQQIKQDAASVTQTETKQILATDGGAAPTQSEIVATKTEPEQQETVRTEVKCPKCGGDLILRTATRGVNAGNRFYGCSNFPKCKYVRNVTTETEHEV